MIPVIEQLQQLGFSQYEAQAYITLLQRNPLNGYELAKLSGIPRPNVYNVLHKLEDRGAVVRLDSAEGLRYAPVASAELIRRLQSNFQQTLEIASQALEQVKAPPPEQEHIWNSRGYPALLDHARSFIAAAEKQLLVALWPQEAQALAEPLEGARARGVAITTLCLAGCPQDCGNCRGEVYRYHVTHEAGTRWLMLVPDEAEVLAGEVGPGDEALAIRTRQRLLVNLAGWYIRQSIALSAMLLDLGDHLDDLLTQECRATLQALGPAGSGIGWLDHMRRMLGKREQSVEAGCPGNEQTIM